MHFIYYMELWSQTLVVTKIALVDFFQKITISEYYFSPRLKNITWNHNKIKFWFRH